MDSRLPLVGPSSIQILVYGVRKELRFIFLYRYAVVPTPCFKWTVLLFEIYEYFKIKSINHPCMGLFMGSLFLFDVICLYLCQSHSVLIT